MSAYRLVLSLHVIIAILALGQLAAAVFLRNLEPAQLSSLARNGRIGLGLMLVTGVLLEYLAGGPWHDQTWFRASFLLLTVTAFLVQRTGLAARTDRMRSARQLAGGACALVGLITLLMEIKPL
jgi:hypothetical protein